MIRITQPTFLEYKTDFICGHCKSEITIEGEYARNYVINPPNSCPNGCKGRPYTDTTNIVNENFITYQEIKIMVRKMFYVSAFFNSISVVSAQLPFTLSVIRKNSIFRKQPHKRAYRQ